MVGVKGKSGRHKRNCECERCMAKRNPEFKIEEPIGI